MYYIGRKHAAASSARNTSVEASSLLQICRHIRKLALVQLCLPEDGVGVVEAVLDPSVLLDVVEVDETSRVSVAVGGGKNTAPAELQGILVRELVLVFCIEHTVGKRLTGTNAEEVAGKTRAVAVDVVESGAFLRGHTGAHGALKTGWLAQHRRSMAAKTEWTYHGQSHALVGIDEVGEDLGGSGDGDAALVAELMEATLHAQVGQPVLAVL
jgi:hypothetical protein